VKTDITTPGVLAQSRARQEALKQSAKAGTSVSPAGKDLLGPAYKVELSSKTPSAMEAVNPPVPSTPSAPPIPKPDLDLPRLGEEKVKDVAKDKIKEEVKSKEIAEVKQGSLKKPAIIFIKGWDVFSSPSKSESGYAGVGKIADSIEGSRIYGHDQKKEIVKEIMKVHSNYPVILVGHSFGGDTAVEVANELDSLEHKFRKVDLLITIDAVGFNNDIIPQNVKNHLNIFGENNFFLNDGPHVARRHELTKVTNMLSPLDHTDIDDDREVQYEVVKLIQETLNGVV
jgi:hypothetical protein